MGAMSACEMIPLYPIGPRGSWNRTVTAAYARTTGDTASDCRLLACRPPSQLLACSGSKTPTGRRRTGRLAVALEPRLSPALSPGSRARVNGTSGRIMRGVGGEQPVHVPLATGCLQVVHDERPVSHPCVGQGAAKVGHTLAHAYVGDVEPRSLSEACDPKPEHRVLPNG